jgi:cullin-associated NEDD8-dissociated protein 1
MELIEELIKRNHEGLTTEMVSNIIVNATNQMSDNDLVLAQMSIRIITALIKLHSSPSNLDLSQRVVYDKVLNLASSQKDLGVTLDVITQLLAVMCAIKGTTLTCSQIIQDIFTKKLTLKDVSSSKQSILNLALCAASLVRESPSSASIISKLATTISSASSGLPDKLFALSTLGEVGRVIDFSQDTANTNIILDCFQNSSEDIKYFAAISFGKLCVGNMDHFISIIMKYIRTNHQVHLILISLKEAINIHVIQKKSFEPYFDSRHGNLDQCFRALVVVDDESIRNVVTECMGLLLRIHEHQVLPWFISLAQGSKIEKWTALTGLKHAMSNREFKSPTIFGHLFHFFELLDDPDVDVRKSALLLLNTAYFYHPNLSENFHLYASIAPKVIRELEFEKIITLDLGAVKHTEDVGRPIRKAALTCLETILSCSGEGLDIVPFIDPLKKLLKDKEKEIRPQACQVIIKMCTIHPLFMSSLTSQLIEPLESMLSAAAADQKKVSRGDPDYDRCKEVFRVCFETIDAISKIDAVTHNPLWMEFSERIKKNPDYNKGE